MAHAAGAANAVGVTSNTVPWEVLEAAGLTPVVLNPPPGPTPIADRLMEPVFEMRIRRIFDGLAAGHWPFLKRVIVSRASEPEHKLFLYLKEASRQGLSSSIPPVELYNLMQSDSEEARAYGLERTRELAQASPEALTAAVRGGNRARQMLARLIELRREARVSGREALPWIGAYYCMNRGDYAEHMQLAMDGLSARPPLSGPRLLIEGGPVEGTSLHQAIEAEGAIVVAENDWWGSRALTRQIVEADDLVAQIFATYYHAHSPRRMDFGWFNQQLGLVDGVVFYFPPDDDVAGWDYPSLRQITEARGLPHLLLSASGGDLEIERPRIRAFVQHLGIRHGR